MAELTPLARPEIAAIPPYVPGKPIEEVQRELGLTRVVKLASNENPLGPSPKALAALVAGASEASVYPDNTSRDLTNALAERLGQPANRVLVGCGSDEIMHLAGLAFLAPGDEVMFAEPGFSVYPITARQMGSREIRVPLKEYMHDFRAMAEAATERTKLIFIGNPHNPTGTTVGDAELLSFLDELPSTAIAVIDEAYGEFAERPDYPRSLRWVDEGRNVIVLRTFSKIYGLAGMRVGYGVAADHLAYAMGLVRMPFTVGRLTQIAALAALGDADHVERTRALNRAGKAYLYAAFERLGLRAAPTEANFILVDLERDSRTCFEAFLRRGVIVRSGHSLGCPGHIRVTVGAAEENALFAQALEEVLEEVNPA